MQCCRCSATVRLPGDRSFALPRSSLWFDFRRRFLSRGVIRFFLQQVVSEPWFGSSAPASVNNLSDLRSSSDPATCRRPEEYPKSWKGEVLKEKLGDAHSCLTLHLTDNVLREIDEKDNAFEI
ncbi:hypothetical protein M9H77_17651 [Catharanthus roseus]|uniref:Uncharacterized protein n=1 Tax=Catharanthus roseus TaxID=4058 RepID=A0ACC0B587_CATRO|nr:hypothetical protein M9H77_17651 [Catharanthus roseus]